MKWTLRSGRLVQRITVMADKNTDAYEFVMSFIAASDKYRSQFVDK